MKTTASMLFLCWLSLHDLMVTFGYRLDKINLALIKYFIPLRLHRQNNIWDG